MPSVKVMAGPGVGGEFAVRPGAVLGRDVAADISLTSPGISRRHLQFHVEGGDVWVEDLGSVNGTFVNGAKVQRQRLADGDTLQVNDVVLRFSMADLPEPTTPPRREAPPTTPMSAEMVQALLERKRAEARQTDEMPIPSYALIDDEEDDAAPGDGWSYSFDVTGSFASVLDVKLAPPERVAALEKRLKLMFEVTQALAVATSRDGLFAVILDKLLDVYPHADLAAIYLGTSADELLPVMTRHRAEAQGRAALPSRTIAHEVFDQKKAILCADAGADQRFAGAESIADLRLSAFMVAPLVYQEREVYGFLQLQGQKRFTRDDLEVLAGLAGSAALFLKNQQLFEAARREAREREAIQSELRIAATIQAQLLPSTPPALSWLQVAGRMRNAKHVGGDYFDYLDAPDGALHVVIGDVSGKGVPAGLVMVSARSILHALVTRDGAPDEPRAVAIEANRLLRRGLKPGMFLSLLLGRCDEARSAIRFAGCGHERPLVYRAATGQVETLDLAGTVLGVVPDNSNTVAEAEVVLAPGDQVLLYTDGVTEALSVGQERYTVGRLAVTLARHGAKSAADLIAAIDQDLTAFVGEADPHDDITMIALRRS